MTSCDVTTNTTNQGSDPSTWKKEESSYSTPQEFWQKLDDEFHFTLDVAADASNTKCIDYFTKEQNALKQDWSGVCWCNPPFTAIRYKDWMTKIVAEQAKGVTTVLLCPARTSTHWFHDQVVPNAEVRFVRGNLKFGTYKTALPMALMVCIFRGQNKA
jgi:phage N-6-adenine-methyltransferase